MRATVVQVDKQFIERPSTLSFPRLEGKHRGHGFRPFVQNVIDLVADVMLVLQQQSTARQMRGHVVVAFEKIPDRFQFFVGEDDDRGLSKRTESTDEVNIGLVRLLSKLISYRGARWPKRSEERRVGKEGVST